jgi:methionine-rich copper-binding protein CopC
MFIATLAAILCGVAGISTMASAAAPKATLKKAELNQAVFAAPGNLTIAALLTADHSSSSNCNFFANIFKLADGADAINLAVVSGVKLTGSLPGLVGPVPANLQPGKYRVDFVVENEATSACKGSVSANFEVKRQMMGPGPEVSPQIILVNQTGEA